MAELPRSLRMTTIVVAGKELRVHVLDDGRKVIVAEDMQALVDDLAEGRRMVTPDDLAKLHKDLRKLSN